MAALGRRGRHGSNWEAQSTQAGAVESGSHPATHRMKGESGMAAGGKPRADQKIAFSCVSNGAIKRTFQLFSQPLAVSPPKKHSKLNSQLLMEGQFSSEWVFILPLLSSE